MLIVALVLAVIGLAALVTAVVTGNEMVAWVCIAASVAGVVLLIVDAVRERHQGERVLDDQPEADESVETTYENFDADYPTDEYPEGGDGEPPVDVSPDDDADSTPTGAITAQPDETEALVEDDKPSR